MAIQGLILNPFCFKLPTVDGSACLTPQIRANHAVCGATAPLRAGFFPGPALNRGKENGWYCADTLIIAAALLWGNIGLFAAGLQAGVGAHGSGLLAGGAGLAAVRTHALQRANCASDVATARTWRFSPSWEYGFLWQLPGRRQPRRGCPGRGPALHRSGRVAVLARMVFKEAMTPVKLLAWG